MYKSVIMQKIFIFLITLCTTGALYSADNKQCAQDMFTSTVLYLTSETQKDKTRFADDISALVRQCPGNFHEQAHAAGSLVTRAEYAVARECGCGKIKSFDCRMYREQVQAANLLKYQSALLRTLITRDAS